MYQSVIVWDIETVPDLRGYGAAKGLVGKPDAEVRAEMGDKFPKLIYHSIVCIGALVAQRRESIGRSLPLVRRVSAIARKEKSFPRSPTGSPS